MDIVDIIEKVWRVSAYLCLLLMVIYTGIIVAKDWFSGYYPCYGPDTDGGRHTIVYTTIGPKRFFKRWEIHSKCRMCDFERSAVISNYDLRYFMLEHFRFSSLDKCREGDLPDLIIEHMKKKGKLTIEEIKKEIETLSKHNTITVYSTTDFSKGFHIVDSYVVAQAETIKIERRSK